MKKREIIEQLRAHGDDDEEVAIVLDGDLTTDQAEDLEDGSILEITDVGGYQAGMRIIRVKPL